VAGCGTAQPPAAGDKDRQPPLAT